MDTKALRQKILDLAIRGKLVPQDPNDEPASVLLERIREQKKQMVKEGKLKAKDIKNDTIIFLGEDNLHYEKFQDGTVKCIEDEIPFEVQEGWCWTRLGCITDVIQYGLSNSAESSGDYRLLRITDIQDGSVNWNSVPFTSTNEPEKYLLHKDDIVFARTGATVGKSFLITDVPYASVYASYLIRIRLIYGISANYIYQFFNSYCYWSQITDKAVGVGQPNCNGTSLKELLIPLPPQREQDRIVPAANNLLKISDVISSEREKLSEVIQTTKSKIFDLAIRGKLVPQDPNDEPASVLLERIRAEKEELIKQGKLKRDKEESIIFRGDDNSYYAMIEGTPVAISEYLGFELPIGWTWITLGDIALVTSGKTPKSIHLSISGEVPYFKVADMNVQGNELYMQYSDNYVNESYSGPIFEKGSFIFPKNGGAVLTNKKRILLQPSVVDLNTGVFKPSHLIDSKFAFYLFTSIDFSKIYKGAVIPTVDSSVIRNLIYAMPPLEEQKRIASAITTIFTKIEKIEDALF